MSSKWYFLPLLLSFLLAEPSFAAGVNSLQEKARKNSSVHQTLRYSVTTDAAEKKDPTSYTHNWSYGLSKKLSKSWMGGLGLSFGYYSYGNNIDSETVKAEDAGLSFTYDPTPSRTHSFVYTLGLIAPLSEESQYEGYWGLLRGNVSLRSKLWVPYYTMRNSFAATFIGNRYDYSPVSRETNPVSHFYYGMNHSFTITDWLFLTLGFGYKSAYHVDGTWKYNYNNRVQLSTGQRSWSASLTYINGGYTEEGDLDLIFYDQYRRLFVLSGSINW
jgi:hypothetical protein